MISEELDELDSDDEDEDDRADDEDGPTTKEDLAEEVAQALADSLDGCANCVSENGQVLLDLDDGTSWRVKFSRVP